MSHSHQWIPWPPPQGARDARHYNIILYVYVNIKQWRKLKVKCRPSNPTFSKNKKAYLIVQMKCGLEKSNAFCPNICP